MAGPGIGKLGLRWSYPGRVQAQDDLVYLGNTSAIVSSGRGEGEEHLRGGRDVAMGTERWGG